jgi:fucose permease
MSATAQLQRRTDTHVVLIAFAAFIGLGLAGGLRGVAWPSIRDEFGLPADGLGVLIFTQTLGYILSSFFSGRISRTLGNGQMYFAGSLLMGFGLLIAFIAPAWWVFIASSFLIGACGGLIDAGLNSYMAAFYGPRQMNWLHACFGIGATIGPLIMTAILNIPLPWRAGYGLSGLILLLLAAFFYLTLKDWRNTTPNTGSHTHDIDAPMRLTLSQPVLWLSVLLFAVFCGMEVGAGDWSYTLFTEGRGIAPDAAGLWVAVYWGSFTVGRILFGLVSHRFRVTSVLRFSVFVSLIGTALWWWNVTDTVGFIGLAILGFAQAPLFPLLILDTANRVGKRHAANAIGVQVAAAGVGIAILPAILGLLVKDVGYEIITPYVLGLAVLTFLLHEATILTRAQRHTPSAV